MGDPYNRVKAGRLTFKGGSVATLSKSIDKKKKKNKKLKKEASFSDSDKIINNAQEDADNDNHNDDDDGPVVVEAENIYTIDAAKKMSYQELFPVEAKKFGYEAKDKDKAKAKAKSESSSVEKALDDRVKKKADRYCK